jgi:RNA recognition motif-containing protein
MTKSINNNRVFCKTLNNNIYQKDVSSEYDKEFMITTTTGSKRSKKSESSFSSSSKSSTSSSPALLVNKENKNDRKKSESRKVSIVDTEKNKDDNESEDNDDRKSESVKNEPKLSSRERETLKKTGKEYDMKCLFVDNLPEFVTRSELDSLFPKNVQMFLQHNNRLKYSFAFVYFATEKDAEKAKMSVLGKKWKGKLMKVSYSFVWDSSKSSNSGGGDNKSSNQQKVPG